MLGAQGLEDDYLIDAVHEFGRELAARGIDGRAIDLLVERVVDLHRFRCKAEAAIDQAVHFGSAEVRGHDDDAARKIDAAVIAERQRGLVENAEQQLPERVRGFFDLVKEQDRELELLGVPLVERFLRQQGMSLAMAEVSRRRADQLGNFVGVLELGAIDLDAGFGVAEERLGDGLDDARLSGAGRPEEQEVADWASGSDSCPPGTSDRSRRLFRCAWSWPTILRRRLISKSRASLLRRVGSSTVARFVLIHFRPLIPFREIASLLENCSFLSPGTDAPAFVVLVLSMCKPFANLRRVPLFPCFSSC